MKWNFTVEIHSPFKGCNYSYKCNLSALRVSTEKSLFFSFIRLTLPFFVSYLYTLISCEEGVSVDHFQPVEELLALIASFTLLGKTELKVALCVTNPQPPGFKFDPPLSKGRSSLHHTFCIVILWLPLPNYL